MASPFLAQMALGYAQQKTAQAQAQIDAQKAQELDLRKRELDKKYNLDYQKDLTDLAYQHEVTAQQQKDEVLTEHNTRYGQGLLEQAARSTDPTERKALALHGHAFLNAGAMEPKDVLETMKAVVPPKVSVAERMADRELVDRTNFDAAVAKADTLDMDKLATDQKLYQKVYETYTKGLSPQYRKVFKEHLDELQSFHAVKNNLKMPPQIKDALDQYQSLDRQRKMALMKGEIPEDNISELFDPQINNLAQIINGWSTQEPSVNEELVETYEPVTKTTPPGPLRRLLGMEGTKETSMQPVKHGGKGPQKPLHDRVVELLSLKPNATDAELDAQLKAEGYTP